MESAPEDAPQQQLPIEQASEPNITETEQPEPSVPAPAAEDVVHEAEAASPDQRGSGVDPEETNTETQEPQAPQQAAVGQPGVTSGTHDEVTEPETTAAVPAAVPQAPAEAAAESAVAADGAIEVAAPVDEVAAPVDEVAASGGETVAAEEAVKPPEAAAVAEQVSKPVAEPEAAKAVAAESAVPAAAAAAAAVEEKEEQAHHADSVANSHPETTFERLTAPTSVRMLKSLEKTVGHKTEFHMATGVTYKHKTLSPDELSTMVDRLCTVKKVEEANTKIHAVKLVYADGKETYEPVKEVTKEENTAYMSELYERCQESRKKAQQQLADKYLQPLYRPPKMNAVPK